MDTGVNADDTAYDRAIEYAAEVGAEHGKAAASWYFDGNTERATYAAVLRGLDDGDPAILDTLPQPDLSGEWADSLTGPQLVQDAIVHADDWTMTRAEWVAYWAEREPLSDICDAYETAYSDAAQGEIERVARYQLALTHRHSGGRIHNHEHYAVGVMGAPGTEH